MQWFQIAELLNPASAAYLGRRHAAAFVSFLWANGWIDDFIWRGDISFLTNALHIAFTLAPIHNTSHCILQVSTLVFLYVHGQTSLAPLPAGPASLSPRKPPQKMKEQSVPVSPLAPLPRPPPFAQAGCGAPQPGQQLAGNRLPGPPIQQQMMAGYSESAPSVIAPYQPARIPPLCRLRQAGSSAPPGHPAAH